MSHVLDYYDVLGVPETATPEQIKRAYFRSVRKYRPVEHPEAFQRFNEANTVLSNPQRRDEYNQMRRYGARVRVLMDQAAAASDKDPEKAIRLFKHALLLAPDLSAARTLLAGELVRVREYRAAETELRWLVAHHPKDAPLRYQLGRCLWLQRSLAAAEQELLEAVKINPHYHEAFVLLAQVYQAAKQPARAVELLEKAIAIDGAENFADFDVLLRLFTLYLLGENYLNVERTGRRIEAILPNDVEKVDHAMTSLRERAAQFARAGNYVAAGETLRYARHPLMSAELAASIARLSALLPLHTEAQRACEDELISAPLKAYLHARYLQRAREGDSQSTDRIPSGIDTEIATDPHHFLRSIGYLRHEYPLVAQDQSAYLNELSARLQQAAPSHPQPTMPQPLPQPPSDEEGASESGFLRRLFRFVGQ